MAAIKRWFKDYLETVRVDPFQHLFSALVIPVVYGVISFIQWFFASLLLWILWASSRGLL